MLQMKRQSLTRAFELLSSRTEVDSLGNGLLRNDFRTLINLVFKPPVSPRIHKLENLPVSNVLWSLLENNGSVDKEAFLQLAELLNMNIKLIPIDNSDNCIFEKLIPSVYNSVASKLFRKGVKSKYFRYLFDVLILLNAILIAVQVDRGVNRLEWILLLLFTLEIFAKLYTFGFTKFIRKFWNVFDTIVIGAALTLWMIIESRLSKFDNLEQYLDLFLILRILRLWKVIADIERFSVVVKTIQALLPSILTYGGLLSVVFYIYAIIGMHFFREKIPINFNCSNSTVNCCPKNAIGLQYCTINFDSLQTSLLYLFDLMVVNQWHIMAKNIEIAVGSKWTRLYFLSFHLICVITVLNIFTAFVLEAFILEYTNVTEGTQSGNELKTKINLLGISSLEKAKSSNAGFAEDELDLVDADHDDFRLATDNKTRDRSASIISISNEFKYKVVFTEKKSVEALLLRMFESEIKEG